MNNETLKISATCKNNTSCTYTGENLQIEITIKNVSSEIIGFPLKYIIRRGPKIKLINEATKEERPQRINLAPYELLTDFTRIKPGESIIFDATIPSSEILAFKEKRIDIVAEIRASVEISIGEKHDLHLYNDFSELRITGEVLR